MKLADVAVMCVVCTLMMGCERRESKQEASRKLDTELVNVLNNIGLENAIIAQHTLYPYHFVPDGETLNTLGDRDLAVLAKHFQKHPGTLNIRRGDVPDELYDARVTHAVEMLKQYGVKIDRVSISDSLPGGTGMPSERVVMILDESIGKDSARRRTGGNGRITQ
jgi:hypothetical protein